MTGPRGKRPAIASFPLAFVILVPGVFAAWLYWPVLHLPNMYDTLLHTQLTEGLSLTTVWLSDDRFGFYRPLVFLPLVIIRELTGGFPASLLQGLNLAQHTLNAILTAGLAWRLTGRRWPALTAGLLLAAFPFGYQAMAIYGNNGYLTVSGLLLLGIFLWLSERPWVPFALALVQLAALLVHEIGVLLFPLILLVESARPGGRFSLRRPKIWPLLVVLVAYLALYAVLPRGGGPLLDFGGNDPWLKLLLFLQTAAYPIVWLAHRLPDLPAVTVIVSGALMTGLAAVWRWRHSRAARPLLGSGLGWWLLASLLVAITLPTYYIADGARLLYPGGIGLAFFWAGLTTIQGEPRFRLAAPFYLAVTAAILVTSTLFIRQMIAYYRVAGEPVAVLIGSLARQPAGEGVLWVNPPQWVSPPRNTYALGTELAPLLGSHLFASELILANGGGERPVAVLLAPELLVETPYHYGLYELTAVDQLVLADLPASVTHVFVTGFEETGLRTLPSGRVERRAKEGESRGMIGPFLLQDARAAVCGETIHVEMDLAHGAELPPNVSLFVQALGADGRLLVQQDGPPLGIPAGRLVWSEGITVVERRLLAGAGTTPAVVLLGAYDFSSGERFAAFDETGMPLVDDAYPIFFEDGAALCPELP